MKQSIESKREELALRLPPRKSVMISLADRRCANCAYFRPYFAQNAGNLYGWVSTPLGQCLVTGKDDKRAICGACKEFERNDAK